MPKTSEMTPSKYLKQEDVGKGILVTIKDVSKENIGKEDEPEFKWVCSFEEVQKPLVLNKTNINRLEAACKSDNTDDWTGKQVVLFTDPSVEFGGKLVGGIRVRAPKGQAPDDDLPF